MGKKKKDKSVKLSLTETKELYGVKIVKLPVGRYLDALTTIENLPAVIANKLIPETESVGQLLEKLITADKETVGNAAAVLLTKVPQELCRCIARLLDIPAQRLLDTDNGLTPNELIEIIIAFWEMNDLSDFFTNVRKCISLTALKTSEDTGCKDGLP